jgi:hypothetical protein
MPSGIHMSRHGPAKDSAPANEEGNERIAPGTGWEVAMLIDKPLRRMTLHELLNTASRSLRELFEQARGDFARHVSDCRDLSRPVRGRSRYPSFIALHNAIRRVEEAQEENQQRYEALLKQLRMVRKVARKQVTERALPPALRESA